MSEKKNILITGGAGFIGSNFIPYFMGKYPDYKVINLDLLTYAGNTDNLSEVRDNPKYHFIQGNIGNRELVRHIFVTYHIQGVIHFAAESHVDNSIKGPDIFIQTNINGTFTLLDTAREFWMDDPFKIKSGCGNNRFHHISTDEVFGSLGETDYFTETTPYAPNSPYSASKASADMLVRSYHHTYGLNTVITNCSNNYGPKQHDEKLIPVIIRKALQEENIPIYGDGKNVRDWLFVTDHCDAIDQVFHQAKAGETYTIGGNCEKVNLEVAGAICKQLDEIKPRKNGQSYSELISFVQDRAGHDRRYAINTAKIKHDLNWQPGRSFDEGIKDTVEFYIDKYYNE